MGPRTLVVVAATLFAAAAPAAGQEMATRALPEVCMAHTGHDMSSMSGHDMPEGNQRSLDEAHAALMEGMDEMNAQMMAGSSVPDIDVAFVCSMIPHHLGAISMARAEIAHGDDPWAKEMAQKVLDAQTQEIKDMLDWLEQAKVAPWVSGVPFALHQRLVPGWCESRRVTLIIVEGASTD